MSVTARFVKDLRATWRLGVKVSFACSGVFAFRYATFALARPESLRGQGLFIVSSLTSTFVGVFVAFTLGLLLRPLAGGRARNAVLGSVVLGVGGFIMVLGFFPPSAWDRVMWDVLLTTFAGTGALCGAVVRPERFQDRAWRDESP